ncbi:hypothetical protein J6E39_02465 [bacterium]|nr:hypothetical protein [bacterium]
MKFLLIILVVIGAAWAYMNVDFNKLKTNTADGVSNSVKNEKTIFGVNNSREQNRQQTEDALNQF